jgi:MFS family permease
MVQRFYAKYLDERTIHLITFLGFVFGLSMSILTYVISTYFKEVVGSDNISIFYIISFSIILIALFNLNKLIEGFGRARTLMTLLAAQIGVLFALQFSSITIEGAILLMMYIILFSIIWVVFDVVLEAYSTDQKTGRIRGLFLSVLNLGFLVGPMLSVYLLQHYGFGGIFFVAMILYIIMFLAVFMALNDIKGHVQKQDLSVKKTIKIFKNNPSLIKSYWMSITLRFFYVIMTIYMPLYLREIGLSWTEIGLIFTTMLIPFVLVEYPAGMLADKKYGEKEMLFIGLLIVIISITIMFVVQSTTFTFWAIILFISRIGAALLESMQDSYFYKQINKDDVALINFFRSTRAVAYILSAVLVGVTLLIFDNTRSIFFVLFTVLLIGFYPIVTLKDTK